MDNEIKLSESTVQKIISYLATCPYKDVASLMMEISVAANARKRPQIPMRTAPSNGEDTSARDAPVA